MEASGARWMLRIATLAVAITGLAGCVTSRPGPTPVVLSPSAAIATGAAPSATVAPSSSGPARTSVAPAVNPAGPIGATGAIAVLGNDGSLGLVDSSGRSILLASADEGIFQFPAWSPDGTRIAAIRYGDANRILVFDALPALAGESIDPLVIFESASIGPFYLSWLPDGQAISFLASEGDALSLRIAPADASAPLDGSGPGATIGTGSPFYFDWLANDRLFAHVGIGPSALLGELELDGDPAAPGLTSPGEFRSAVASGDGQVLGFVRVADDGESQIITAARAGGSEHAIPVFGATALAFHPTSHTLASIGPSVQPLSPVEIPIGPLRLLDADTGTVGTLLDGQVLSFWWSPDGSMIAALRIQPIEGPASSASPVPSPGATTEARLLFIDVATAEIRSQVVVDPARLFIDQLLSFFDQYALSHRLWSPDNSALLFPIEDSDGVTRIAVFHVDGDPPAMIDGAAAFWSP